MIPVVAQQLLPGRRVKRLPPHVGREEVAHERQVVREALMGKKIHLPVQNRIDVPLSHHFPEIALELGARKDAHHFLRQTLELRGLLAAEIPAREFLVPGAVGKLAYGAAVDLLHFRSAAVLVQEGRQALVEFRIVWIAVDLPAIEIQSLRDLLHQYQPCDVPIQHQCVLRKLRRGHAGCPASTSWRSVLRGGGGSRRATQRQTVRAGGELLQKVVVSGEFFPRLVLARMGFGHEQRNARALRGCWKSRKKGSRLADHAIVVAVSRVGFQKRGAEIGSLRAPRKAGIKERQELGGPRTVEVGHGSALLRGITCGRRFGIQQQRQYAVQEPGIRIHGRHIAVERKVSRTKTDGRVRGVQEKTDQAGKRLFRGGSVVPREAVQGIVVAGGFVIAVNPFEQLAQGPELIGIPGGLARLFAQTELRQGALRRGEVSLLLVVVKDACGCGQVLRV